MLPYIMNLIDVRINQQISQQNTPVEQAERARTVAHAIYQFYPLAIPVIVIVFMLFFAWLVSAMASMAGIANQISRHFLADGGLLADSGAPEPSRLTSCFTPKATKSLRRTS